MTDVLVPNKIIVAVDTIILAIGEKGLDVLLTKIKNGPYGNRWAIPGSVVQIDESLDETAKRVLVSRVGNDNLHLEQLYTFGDPKRDIRGRSISVAYFSLLSNQTEVEPKLVEVYADVSWFSVDKLPEMAFDHEKVVKLAKDKLAYKLDEPEIIKRLLPVKFTLAELKRVHEILSEKTIDKRNFVKKVKNDGDVVVTKDVRSGGAHRPAKLFRFR